MKKMISLLLLSFLATGCGVEKTSRSSENENLASSVEDAVTTVSALMDEQAGEAYTSKLQKSYPELIKDLFFPKAYAEGCIRPIQQACENGVKSSLFQSCSLSSRVEASGEISLEFNQLDCSISLPGDRVSRTYDYGLTGVHKGVLSVSSGMQGTYTGESLGGGSLLVKTAVGYELSILGKHKLLKRNGQERMNKTIRTLAPLEVSGGLSRALRQVNNGQLQVFHNLAKFTATYTVKDLSYSSSCCHPISGSLEVEYTGSIEGRAVVNFGSCGEATLTRSGETQDVLFSYCE